MNPQLLFGFPKLTPFVRKLLIVLFGCFVVELIVENWVGFSVYSLLALSTNSVSIPSLWQIVTHVFVQTPNPQGVSSLIFELLFLWLIVSPFEERYGTLRTAQLCFFAALASASSALLVGLWLRQSVVLSGASSLSLAGVCALALSTRADRILLFGVFPMRPKHLIWLTVGLSALVFLASANAVSFAASLGAIAAGVGFIRWMMRPRRPKSTRKMETSKPFQVIYGMKDESDPDRPNRWLN